MNKPTLGALLVLACASSFSYAENTGWYIGGSLDGVFLNDADGEFTETDPGVPPLIPASTTTTPTDSEYDGELGFGLNLGYDFAGIMRAELEARRHSIEDEGNDLDSEIDTTSILANLWFDFNREGKFKPYVGFGLGASEVDPGGASETLGTWQVGGGVNWQLAPSWVMDMGYRYFETEDGEYEDDGVELEQEHGGNIFKIGINYLFNPAKPANLDDDGDGVFNNSDQCPNTPLGTQVNPSTGCELDSDNDGVVNSADDCPNSPPGSKVLSNGCAPGDNWVLEGVNFETNSVVFVGGARAILDEAVRLLQANPSAVIEIQGHTDDRGSDYYNEQLSDRRARRVRDYLVEAGISADRLTARGYGESEPTATNDTASGRAANRRVALSIVSR